MRFHTVKLRLVVALVCFLSLTWITFISSDGDSEDVPDVQTLYKRLKVMEKLGGQVHKDLKSIRERLNNASIASNQSQSFNTSSTRSLLADKWSPGKSGGQTFILPNIYIYMPHLTQHQDSLVPNVVLGRGRRGVSLVLGVPTVKRNKQNYLLSTLGSLLYGLTASQQQDLLIIVFMAETDWDFVNSTAETISRNFPAEVRSGLLEVVTPSQYYYPDFSKLRKTFGDSKERVKWRTKQNLDFSFLMLYARDKGTYYVQLEDDLVAKADYYESMKNYANQQASKQWLFVEFSQLGFIGKMFRSRDLPMIAEFFFMFHADKPIDWLLDHILWVKVCNPEKDKKDCEQQKSALKQVFKPSLFQHVGLHSSLSGKLQKLKDKDFGKQTLHRPHSNPQAELNTSMKHYQQHSLQRLYDGLDFFWALTPVCGDYIVISFPKPMHLKGYLFRSGNIETVSDKFSNTTVEVLPGNATTGQHLPSDNSDSVGGFITIGTHQSLRMKSSKD
ncbi:alpha-1,3-mannosyl-glycoprotein 4-beta-N-acetylglucosaminyltransferase B-like isoform X2 [Gouania willdenowi]|uniref:Alpha-1,3-mannosyl-glycoprotein 4-beta-N-acetylglucosaminyltransferase B-like n=1 Tax=Gouania willdenowi TaxID=441366 RepID=A0A8C5GMT9_GOUWI|nr:alpha-1,3-mannosyl-glycoprotein 4-beta-N-acetylglucosaminyltransferase B-like isoform X2 [Gouania willdenowi]